MNTGILESVRIDAGMTKAQFKDSDIKKKAEPVAKRVVDQMMNFLVVKDVRNVAAHIRDEYDGKFMIGPTCHKYLIDNDEDFSSGYLNFLQSYEFYLIATGTLLLKEKYPAIEVIGHYHDGNTIAVSRGTEDRVTKDFNSLVEKLGKELSFHDIQTLKRKIRIFVLIFFQDWVSNVIKR